MQRFRCRGETLQVPQIRGVEFYPSALEKGVPSVRALKLAVAEMYVQGVSTRKVTANAEQLCRLEVASSQVSRAAQALDAELAKWRDRPPGETPYLILGARYEHVRQGGQANASTRIEPKREFRSKLVTESNIGRNVGAVTP